MLEEIIANGNRGHAFITNNRVMCADGFSLSVIAGGGAYSDPRPDMCSHSFQPDEQVLTALGSVRLTTVTDGDVEHDYPGPYKAVEVGYPSERPEPWDLWSRYVETPDRPTETVYAYVPVEMVRDLVERHGGEANVQA